MSHVLLTEFINLSKLFLLDSCVSPHSALQQIQQTKTKFVQTEIAIPTAENSKSTMLEICKIQLILWPWETNQIKQNYTRHERYSKCLCFSSVAASFYKANKWGHWFSTYHL